MPRDSCILSPLTTIILFSIDRRPYLTTFSIYRGTDEAELLAAEDLFVFEGKYYGDMSIFIARPSNLRLKVPSP